jgi:peptide/nickel transport system substrate-binding protein
MSAARFGRRALGAFSLASSASLALGRTPLGGTLRLSLPFGSGELDPQAPDEPLAALLGPAIADTLFALGPDGRPYPALAAAMPEPSAGARVTLRPGLVSGRGKKLEARDVVFALGRARKLGAATLAELAPPRLDPRDPLAFTVNGVEPEALALALTSPLTALVPRGFSALAPDGTGAFRATLAADRVLLEMNPNAARGPSFLQRIEVQSVPDLAEALRAFETERADVGWLGGGLHSQRPRAVPFEGPTLGWVVLRTGRELRAWSAPGIAQQLMDRVPVEQLRHLGIVPAGGVRLAGAPWGGGSVELLVPHESPQLRLIAEGLATLLSTSDQSIRSRSIPRDEVRSRRASGRFPLLLDFVRAAGPPGRATLLSLLAAVNPELAARPPRVTSFEPIDVARTLPFGVVGALRVAGSRMPELNGLESWQLGSVFLAPKPSA